MVMWLVYQYLDEELKMSKTKDERVINNLHNLLEECPLLLHHWFGKLFQNQYISLAKKKMMTEMLRMTVR